MRGFKHEIRFGYIMAIILGVGMICGGCAATINYSYDPVADFSTIKNYSWGQELSVSIRNDLIEKNVRYYADRILRDKGFTLTPDKPDFVISMNYQLGYYSPYEMRILNLYIYRTQGKELIWQGTADGTISGDAASADLAEGVKKILMNFPPKR